MTISVIVNTPSGVTTYTDDDFPIAIGVGPGAKIELPGHHEQGIFAYLGYAENAIFVQPTGHIGIHLNHQAIDESSWLLDGDIIRMGKTELKCEFDGRQLNVAILQPATGNDAPVIIPPSTPPQRKQTNDSVPLTPQPKQNERTRNFLLGLISLLFVFLVVIAGYVFTAKSVSLQITPESSAIKLTGGMLKINVAGRYLLRPGNYQIDISKKGYLPIHEIIKVDDRSAQKFEYALQPLPGRLKLNLLPKTDAKIKIDGNDLAAIPADGIELAAGTHSVQIRSNRYLPVDKDITIIGKGEWQSLDITLVPGWAEVFFDSLPSGAAILVNDEIKAKTPATIDIMNGVQRIEVRKKGFESWRTDLRVEANHNQTFSSIELKKADGEIFVTSTPNSASISINGVYRGLTPLSIPISSEIQHDIQASKLGHKSTTRTVAVDPTLKKKIHIKLTPRLGVVIFKIQPTDTQIFVDGKAIRPNRNKFNLSAIPHRLEIKKSGYQTHRDTITPRVGYTQEVIVQLKPSSKSDNATSSAKHITSPGGQQLRRIKPPGQFTMGASRREQGRRSNETLHSVKLTKPYYISVKEVSNGEYRRFQASHSSGYIQRYSLDEDNNPVVQVTWNDAARYCNWLSKKASLPPAYTERAGVLIASTPLTNGYRLPTEAEWAWVARFANGAKLKYPWGSGFPPNEITGNYADTRASTMVTTTLSNYDDKYPTTAPVGSFKPNSLGLYDLGGNVAEWVHNFYTIHSNTSSNSTINPVGPLSGTHHTIRGSSWRHGTITELRLSYRDYGQKKRQDLGFRIARYAD